MLVDGHAHVKDFKYFLPIIPWTKGVDGSPSTSLGVDGMVQ